MRLEESKNGVTVVVEHSENHKCMISLFGKPSRETRQAAERLQYSLMPAAWVMRQILKTI